MTLCHYRDCRGLSWKLAVAVCLLVCVIPAQADEPRNGLDWYQQARALQDEKKYDAALEAYRHALELEYQPAGALMRMAQIEAAQGKKDAAMKHLREAWKLAPSVIALLPQLGGIPELEDNPDFRKLMAEAEQMQHPCKTQPESVQFDFWLGDWTVASPQGQVVGENHIMKDLEGCVVRESWTNAYGSRGTSVNFYDPATKLWHQVWTSDGGTITHYEGRLENGAMRFEAKGFGDADGTTQFRRMIFTPNADGSVRQYIEDSTDGKNWTPSFDGIYRRQ